MRRAAAGKGQGDLFEGDPELSAWLEQEKEEQARRAEEEKARTAHRCDGCKRPISAEEARASGLGEKCAAELGRAVHVAKRRKQRRERKEQRRKRRA